MQDFFCCARLLCRDTHRTAKYPKQWMIFRLAWSRASFEPRYSQTLPQRYHAVSPGIWKSPQLAAVFVPPKRQDSIQTTLRIQADQTFSASEDAVRPRDRQLFPPGISA